MSDSIDLINEYKDQVRILKQEVAELQDAGKSKDSANKRCLQKLEHLTKDLEDANKILEGKPVNHIARECVIELVFNIGMPRTKKFVKMLSALDREDYGEASFQMLDSLWAKQTPARAGKLAGKMRSAKS